MKIPVNQILCVDWVEGSRQLPNECIDMVITSPPYWLMRNYFINPIIFDGLPNCDHEWGPSLKIKNRGSVTKSAKVSSHKNERQARELNQGKFCQICDAWFGQLGAEPTPELYIKHLMDGFVEVKRVLKSTGTCWVNIGDKRWNAKGSCFNPGSGKHSFVSYRKKRAGIYPLHRGNKSDCPGLTEKSLAAIPERFVLGMLEMGWIYRQHGVWLKLNHKPESVKDRLTDCWEPLYFFTKNKKYYFDLDAIRVPHKESSIKRAHRGYSGKTYNNKKAFTTQLSDNMNKKGYLTPDKMNHPLGKNPGDIFFVACRKIPGIQHFSTFPEKLIEEPIKACCPQGGIVLDTFMGIGTTAKVAKNLGMNYIGFDIDPECIKISDSLLARD